MTTRGSVIASATLRTAAGPITYKLERVREDERSAGFETWEIGRAHV